MRVTVIRMGESPMPVVLEDGATVSELRALCGVSYDEKITCRGREVLDSDIIIDGATYVVTVNVKGGNR